MDKEIEIKDLERNIWDKLESEKLENAEKEAKHKRETDDYFKANQLEVKKIVDVL